MATLQELYSTRADLALAYEQFHTRPLLPGTLFNEGSTREGLLTAYNETQQQIRALEQKSAMGEY